MCVWLIRSYFIKKYLTTFLFKRCTKCLVDFTNQELPSVTSLLQFILPFLILAVVSGMFRCYTLFILYSLKAYNSFFHVSGVFTETNGEGLKLTFAINPLKERLKMLDYLNKNPLQMRLYGFVLDYGTELQFVAVFAVGFLTQVIFHEI